MVRLIDTTLREGEQTPGVFFDLAQKKEIVKGLLATGIDELELGIVGAGDTDLKRLCQWVHGHYPEQRFALWSRCCFADIYAASTLRPPVLALSIPVSDLHIREKISKDRTWVRDTLVQSIRFAFFLGVQEVAVGFEDATRADINFIRELACLAQQEGAFRVRLADTVGVASPRSICELIDSIADVGVEVGLHCHNDFGMATANTIAGLEHGAHWADVTVLGLGERAGNSRLEEVVSYFALQTKTLDYHLLSMRTLSEFVMGLTERAVAQARPIIGDAIFSCETGLHLQGLMTNPQTYEPYDPVSVGGKRQILIGGKVGRYAVGKTLKRLGVSCPDGADLTEITRRIRALAREKKRPLGDQEIVGLATMCLG